MIIHWVEPITLDMLVYVGSGITCKRHICDYCCAVYVLLVVVLTARQSSHIRHNFFKIRQDKTSEKIVTLTDRLGTIV